LFTFGTVQNTPSFIVCDDIAEDVWIRMCCIDLTSDLQSHLVPVSVFLVQCVVRTEYTFSSYWDDKEHATSCCPCYTMYGLSTLWVIFQFMTINSFCLFAVHHMNHLHCFHNLLAKFDFSPLLNAFPHFETFQTLFSSGN
jgi:hypothetical protein